MATKKNILTQEGLKQLEDEMNHLTINRRAEIAIKIKEAREQGDLSENAEYDAALDEQREIESRISELKSILNNAEIADGSASGGMISIGNLVKLYDKTYDEEVKYRIVGTTEADSLNRKISNESPVGSALVGRSKGHDVVVDMRDGKTKYAFTVLEVYETSEAPVGVGSVVRLRGGESERIIEISQSDPSASADDVFGEDSDMAKALLGRTRDELIKTDIEYKIIEVMSPKKEESKPAVAVSETNDTTATATQKSKTRTAPLIKGAVKAGAVNKVTVKTVKVKTAAEQPIAKEKPDTEKSAAKPQPVAKANPATKKAAQTVKQIKEPNKE